MIHLARTAVFIALFTLIAPVFAADIQKPEPVARAPEDPAPPSRADERVKYMKDPVYAPMSGGDHHPLEELFGLAMDGDPRAQFILGDLYSKGKGGIDKRPAVAKMLFEHSAKLGTHESFIRLAALAKQDNNKIEAYKWYDLAIDRLPRGDLRKWAEQSRKALELKGKDVRSAKNAAKEWDLAKLEPLELHHPKNPLAAETESKDIEKTEPKEETPSDE